MTLETRCIRVQLKPNCIDQVRKWQDFLENNKDEAVSTIENEGIYLEAVFLDRQNDGDYLIYVLTSEDFEYASKVATKSQSYVDRFHRQFKQDCWDDTQRLEPLLQLYNSERIF